MPQRVVVVGGGVAGLATAFHLNRRAGESGQPLQVQVLEREPWAGGKIQSVREDDFLCEAGPTGFLDNEPATLRLVDALGLKPQLERSSDVARKRYIFRGGQFHALQMNPVLFMKSPLLSRRGRMRVVGEMFVRARRDGAEETVGAFGRRRLGKEFAEVMLDSMVSGIFAGDIDRLSLPAAFPKIPAMEMEYGGLIKALRAKRAEVRGRKKAGEAPRKVEAGPGGVLHSFREGMGQLIQSLTNAVAPRTGAVVEEITHVGPGFRIHLAEGTLDADAVVVATPAPATADLVRGLSPDAAAALRAIPIAGVHVVAAGFAREQVEHPLDGFGALIPRREQIRILGTLWTSSTFADRAPDGSVLLTSMIGGAHDPAATDLSDSELGELVLREVARLHSITGEPRLLRVFRWPAGIPQYDLGHQGRVERARAGLAPYPGLYLTGNSVAGVSFNHCARHAEEIASEVLEHLRAAAA